MLLTLTGRYKPCTASNRSALTAASACIPVSRIDNRDTRTRTRIRFDNRFFDYRLTCLVIKLLILFIIIFIIIAHGHYTCKLKQVNTVRVKTAVTSQLLVLSAS